METEEDTKVEEISSTEPVVEEKEDPAVAQTSQDNTPIENVKESQPEVTQQPQSNQPKQQGGKNKQKQK